MLLGVVYAVLLANSLVSQLLPDPHAARGDSVWRWLRILLDSEMLRYTRTALLGIVVISYGLPRVGDTHPAMPTRYGAWVAASAWRLGRPLPNGSPFLGLWDVAMIAALTALSVVDVGWPPWLLPTLYLGCYTAMLIPVAVTQPLILLACAVIAPLLFYPHYDPRCSAVVLLVLCGLLTWAMHRRLKRFPFEHDDWRERSFLKGGQSASPKLEYPYDTLGQRVVKPAVSRVVIVLFLALAMWWLHAGTDLLPLIISSDWRELAAGLAGEGYYDDFRKLWWVFVIAVAGIRWLIYRTSAAPPIGLITRVRTGRLVIPAYDRLWIGPLCTVLVGAWAPMVLRGTGVPDMLVFTLSVGATLLTVSLVGPSLEKWRLTGPGRIQKRWRTTQTKRTNNRPRQTNELNININLFGPRA